MIIARPEHRGGIAAALRGLGHDPERLRSQGQLLESDAEESLRRFLRGDLEHGTPDAPAFRACMAPMLQALKAETRFTGLRAYGEMVDLLAAAGNTAAAVRLEELWNELAREHPFQLFCGYSLQSFRRSDATADFERVCALHQQVRPAETFPDGGSPEEQRLRIAKLQQMARALEAQLAERKKAEDEFVALLSHELRNPLAPILTSLDLMDLRGDATSRREREIIRRQARHLANLVEDLLDISRVAKGKITMRRKVVEFAAVADAALETTAPLFEERGHVLELSVPGKGLRLEADPVRLAQVMANLLANAAKYTPRHGRVALRAHREGRSIVVTVEDNGVGIPREKLETIFTPFVQERQGLERSMGGLGLGLTLVRSLTELHGGTVAAHSEGPGMGSRFTLRLPALRRARPQAQSKGNGTEPVDAAPTVRPHRVLVVDDNLDAAVSLGRLVKRLGCEVRVAHDADEALRLARAFGPDTALLDIGLPSMDGYSLAVQLRRLQNGKPLRLIAVSGYGQAADRAKSVLAGFNGHLVKPVEVELLRELLPRAARLESSPS